MALKGVCWAGCSDGEFLFNHLCYEHVYLPRVRSARVKYTPESAESDMHSGGGEVQYGGGGSAPDDVSSDEDGAPGPHSRYNDEECVGDYEGHLG